MDDEFKDLFDEWTEQTVHVDTWLKDSAKGPRFNDSELVDGVMVEERVNLVTDMNGKQVSSTTTIYCPLDLAQFFTPQTVVTYSGKKRTVISVSKFVVVGFPQHAVVYLG